MYVGFNINYQMTCHVICAMSDVQSDVGSNVIQDIMSNLFSDVMSNIMAETMFVLLSWPATLCYRIQFLIFPSNNANGMRQTIRETK